MKTLAALVTVFILSFASVSYASDYIYIAPNSIRLQKLDQADGASACAKSSSKWKAIIVAQKYKISFGNAPRYSDVDNLIGMMAADYCEVYVVDKSDIKEFQEKVKDIGSQFVILAQ